MGGTVPGIISRRAVRLSVLLLTCSLTLLCWERSQLSNGFSLVVGDWLDGRIQASIVAHWYNALRGLESWNNTAYFYPWADTLGYNDGYFLYGVVASVFRYVGVDPFLSVDLANLVIRGICFLACYLFAVEMVVVFVEVVVEVGDVVVELVDVLELVVVESVVVGATVVDVVVDVDVVGAVDAQPPHGW